MPAGQGLSEGVRRARRNSYLPSSNARRKGRRTRVSARVRLRAVLAISVYLVDLSAPGIPRDSRLQPARTTFSLELLSPFKLLGVKYIFDHHDANPELYFSKFEKQGPLYKIQVWLERQTYRFSDVVMATNRSYRDLAVTRGGIAPEDVSPSWSGNGPDLNTFKAVPPSPDLKHGKHYLVGYVGTMSIQEGLDILLDVALHIKSLGRSDIHFTCVGGGPGLAGLRKMVEEKDLGNMVNFTGRVPDKQLLEILSTADVCVNPDKPCQMNDISTMIKIMEYMALGKPIVQFDLKEGRFSAQEASLYADSQNQVADFAAKILWLLENPDARKSMGQSGLKRVAEELAWEYSVTHLLSAYDRTFSKRTERWLPLWLGGSRRSSD